MLSFTSHRLDYRETCKMFQADGPMPKMKASRVCQIWRSLDWRNDTILAFFSPSGLIMLRTRCLDTAAVISNVGMPWNAKGNATGNAKGNAKGPFQKCLLGQATVQLESMQIECEALGTQAWCVWCVVLQFSRLSFCMFLWAVVIRCQNLGCTFSWDIFGHPRRQLLSCSLVA